MTRWRSMTPNFSSSGRESSVLFIRHRATRVGHIVFAGLVVASLSACNRPPPLAPELKAVKCPANHEQHANATFAKASITFVCINKELASSPALLRCDRQSRPMICEDDGSLLFSRSAKGDVYAGLLPEELRRND